MKNRPRLVQFIPVAELTRMTQTNITGLKLDWGKACKHEQSSDQPELFVLNGANFK